MLLAPFPVVLRLFSWAALLLIGAAPLFFFLYLAITGGASVPIAIFALIASAAGILIFLLLQIYMQTTEFAVTDQRLISKRGVFTRYTNEIPLQALENVNLQQDIVARIFGYGRLEINGSGGSPMWTHPLQDPVSFRAAISEARIAVSQAPLFKARAQHIDLHHNHDR
ncbi:MAG: PH domain-containing protein [Parvularcula sp.]|nr:PH domain-containing protein [Parvularcula sp.]